MMCVLLKMFTPLQFISEMKPDPKEIGKPFFYELEISVKERQVNCKRYFLECEGTILEEQKWI